ncbi:Structural maintenance of chromosomes protein 6 [Ciborinia camelliae]|nr:Structural maintenance of chromosomes protein 6 [Ciborinia camelliae]
MAPPKRVRHEEGGVITSESASSVLRHVNQRKRAKISNGQSSSRSLQPRSDSSSSSSEDGSDDDDNDDEEMAMPPGTQYEILRDAGFKHLADPDHDDMIATQQFLAKNQMVGDNHAADNSIIEHIQCVNFMNHENLNVPLGPLINFVVGMNGSGKSAVLTGITLCLGGKPSATNRGSSMKSLIKSGTERGMLLVRLKNQGPDAYQPDKYGKSIIVERHFSRSVSGSSYKLKSAEGKTISTKKGDMDDIVEYFQLQVDNPMNILTQDEAKTFITSSTPAQKFDFFKKGVQLEQLDNDYKLVSESCDQIETLLGESIGDLKGLERQAEEAEAKKKIYDQHQDMRMERRFLNKQLTWCQVEEQENELEERRKAVSETQRKIEERESIVDEKDRVYLALHASVERALEKAKILGDELAPLKEEEQEAKSKAEEADSEIKRLHQEHKESQGELKQAISKAQKIQADIDAEQRRIEDANGGSLNRKFAEIEAAKTEASQARADLERSHGEMQGLIERSQASKGALEQEQGPWTAKKKEVENCRNRLRELQNERPDPMRGFDHKMPELLRRIQQDRGFLHKPVGPIGLHVKLRDPKWSDILEVTFGNTLNGFVVTNKPDQVRLQKIISAMGIPRTQIYITNPEPIDTTNNEPDQNFMTILRMLDIDSEIVRNTLIINQVIEQVLLVDDLKEAMRIMEPRSKPAHVRYCFTPNPQRRGWGIRLYLNGPNHQNSAQDFVKPYRFKSRMNTDGERRIILQQETLKQFQDEESKLASNCRALQQRVQEADRAIQQHKVAQGRMKIRVQKTDERVESLETELSNLNIEDGFLDTLKSQLVEANGFVLHYETAYGATGLARAEYNAKASAQRSAHKAAKKRVETHEKLIADANQKVKAKEQARHLALGEKNIAITHVEEYKKMKTEEESKLAKQENTVEVFIRGATEVCVRIPVPANETRASLTAKLASITNQLEQYNRRLGGTDQEIIDGYARAIESLKSFKERRKHMEELLQILKQSFAQRMKQFRSFQRHISARSRINFNYLLSERAFRGKLEIDHKARLLDVHVEPDETSSNKKGRQTKTLSGGEKSFSSICLLLSLWEAMSAPLRCLDEFDVFMDDVNRDVSTKMIISAARRAVGRQFILITPKALGAGIEVGEDVKIHKLDDPRERNQRSIPEMMGAA